MEKVVRDNMVAVIITGSYGCGWFSWHGTLSALFDPELVEWIEMGRPEDRLEYFAGKYPEYSLSTLRNLRVQWVVEGERFFIDEYDGFENVIQAASVRWVRA